MIITDAKTNVTVDVYFVDDDGGTAPGEPTTGKLFSDIETGGSASYHRHDVVRELGGLFPSSCSTRSCRSLIASSCSDCSMAFSLQVRLHVEVFDRAEERAGRNDDLALNMPVSVLVDVRGYRGVA